MARQSQKTAFGLPPADVAHVLHHAKTDLEALRGAHLFLTGGTGFFGKWLTGCLLEADDAFSLGLQLTLLSREPARFLKAFPEAAEWPTLRFQAGHVADLVAEKKPYDYVLHAATDAVAIHTAEQEADRSRAIVEGTQRVIDLAKACGARRLLNISTGAVYGALTGQPSGAAEEDYAKAQALTPYAEGKRAAEELCAAAGLDFVTARAFAFFGPYLPLDAHFAAGNFLRDALAGGPIVVRGDGTALRSYLYPADLVVWLLRILVRGEKGGAWNVGSDEKVTTAQLARLMAEVVDPKIEVTIQSVQAQGPQNIYLPDIRRARTELGLEVGISLREGILRTVGFLR